MEDDPRVWVGALRSGHDRLAAYVADASAGDFAGPSMCTDWTVGQVLSHLGSGAEINLATVIGEAIDHQEVWARWTRSNPMRRRPPSCTPTSGLVVWWEARSGDELAAMQVHLPFLPAPIDAASTAGFRLSEVALRQPGTCWRPTTRRPRSPPPPPRCSSIGCR